MTDTILAEQKALTRAKLKQIRSIMPDASRKAASEAIYSNVLSLDEVANAKTIFIYISYGNEVDTHNLLKYFLENGKTLVVPKILPTKTMIAVPFSNWDDLAPGELGILTPLSNEPYEGNIDVAITPGLGFTEQGQRIGYGRGYYDQWFASHPVRYKIAITFDAQVIDQIPADSYDIPVDIIVTQKRVIKT